MINTKKDKISVDKRKEDNEEKKMKKIAERMKKARRAKKG